MFMRCIIQFSPIRIEVHSTPLCPASVQSTSPLISFLFIQKACNYHCNLLNKQCEKIAHADGRIDLYPNPAIIYIPFWTRTQCPFAQKSNSKIVFSICYKLTISYKFCIYWKRRRNSNQITETRAFVSICSILYLLNSHSD